MTSLPERLKNAFEATADPEETADLVQAVTELVKRHDELEKTLIMLVRTGWPWDEDGEPNGIFHASRPGYTAAIMAAKELLGLDHRSMITRTEPRT